MRNEYLNRAAVVAAIFLTQFALASVCRSQDLGLGIILQTDNRNNLIANVSDPSSPDQNLIVKIKSKDGTTAWQIAPEKDFAFNAHLVNRSGDVVVLMGGLHGGPQCTF